MANHQNRNKSFQLDGHTGDWLFEHGVLRVRASADGVVIVGTTRVVNDDVAAETVVGRLGAQKIEGTGNTPRAYRPLLGRRFATVGDAKHAIMQARASYIQPTRKERFNEIRARVAKKFPDVAADRQEAIAQMEWAKSRYNR